MFKCGICGSVDQNHVCPGPDTPVPRPTEDDLKRDLADEYQLSFAQEQWASRRAYWAERDLKEATKLSADLRDGLERKIIECGEAAERAKRAEADLKTAQEFAKALSRELADEHPDCSNVKAELRTLVRLLSRWINDA